MSLRNGTKSVISVKEARKLLGKEGDQLTDIQVEVLIDQLVSLSSDFLRRNKSISFDDNE